MLRAIRGDLFRLQVVHLSTHPKLEVAFAAVDIVSQCFMQMDMVDAMRGEKRASALRCLSRVLFDATDLGLAVLAAKGLIACYAAANPSLDPTLSVSTSTPQARTSSPSRDAWPREKAYWRWRKATVGMLLPKVAPEIADAIATGAVIPVMPVVKTVRMIKIIRQFTKVRPKLFVSHEQRCRACALRLLGRSGGKTRTRRSRAARFIGKTSRCV
jgi:hypothetical protein